LQGRGSNVLDMPQTGLADLSSVRIEPGRTEGSVKRLQSIGMNGKGRARIARRFSLDPRGQGLVEFSISFPIVMFMILFGVDFGRVFLGWVTLTNAVREAANFAAIQPGTWGTPGSPSGQAEFARLINAETAEINCTLPATLPAPVFPNGTSIGSPAVVSITCQFSLITPLIGNVVGNPVNVSASASFPIRGGSIEGTPVGETLPTFQATPSAPVVTDTPPPTGSGGPPPSPNPTPTPAITPVPNCVVPDLVQGSLKTDGAAAIWIAAGFSSQNLLFSPFVPPHFDIKDQSRAAGTFVPCTSGMTVYDRNQP
jgi:Flp pilus assembly protein TadG